jgi:hypothetical protein
MVVDNDIAGIALVASDVVPGASDQIVSLSGYPVTSGSHDFAFYAVNPLGWISQPASSTVFVVPAPATTLPQTPTLTQSPMASQSPDPNPSPSPYATCLPLLVTFGDTYLNFNLYWRNVSDNGALIRTSWGYGTMLHVGETELAVTYGGELTLANVTLRTLNVSLSPYTVLVVFVLTNANTALTQCDIAVYADTVLGGNESHHVSPIPDNKGIYMSAVSGGYTLTLNIVAGNYPLTDRLSTYWYGRFYDMLQHCWTNVDGPVDFIGDLAITFSWQQVNVPAGGSATISFLFRSGDHYPDQPEIDMSEGLPPTVIFGTFSTGIRVNDPIPASVLSLFAVFDNDLAGISLVATNLHVGYSVATIDLAAYPIQPGSHQLAFYAVNDLGFISAPVTKQISILPLPTETPSQSPTLTRSPPPSQSPAAFPSPTPFPSSYPIEFTWGTAGGSNFNLAWKNVTSVPSSRSGYSTMLRIGTDEGLQIGGRDTTVADIRLSTVHVSLSPYSDLFVFKFDNPTEEDKVADLAVYADTIVGSNESHSVEVLPGIGLFWFGQDISYLSRDVPDPGTAGHEYSMNIIAGNYPLSTNLSTFWFGSWSAVGDHYWDQTQQPSSYGQDVAVAVSWQGVPVIGESSAVISFLMLSGPFYSAQPMVTEVSVLPTWAVINDITYIPFYISEAVAGDVLRLFLVVDGNLSGITLAGEDIQGNSTFTYGLRVSGLSLGEHNFAFYAVSSYGFVSSPLAPYIEVVERPPFGTEPASRSPFINPSEGADQPAAASSSGAGAIAGGVVGGVLGLALITGVILFVVHRRSHNQGKEVVIDMPASSHQDVKEESLEAAVESIDPDDLDIYFSQPQHAPADLPFDARFEGAEQEGYYH